MGEEEQPIVALARLCEALPDDPNWMKWYSAIVLHTKYYQEATAQLDAPYNVLPAGVYRISDVTAVPEAAKWRALETASRPMYEAEVKEGLHLGGEYYLRRYPVWFQFRGNSSVLLSEAKALSTGYDWGPLYSVRSGQMVGALPVGIETRGIADKPYWPNEVCWTYKEVWTQPAGEWIWLMRDLSGPAVVRGVADPGSAVEFLNEETHAVVSAPIAADGAFRAAVPQGRYQVRRGPARTALTALAGGVYELDLRREHAAAFAVTSVPDGPGRIILRAVTQGTGKHILSVRIDNLNVSDPVTVPVDLGTQGKRVVTWHARVVDSSTPWVAVVMKDGALSDHAELSGITPASN
jgi:hypothetical protein